MFKTIRTAIFKVLQAYAARHKTNKLQIWTDNDDMTIFAIVEPYQTSDKTKHKRIVSVMITIDNDSKLEV